MRIAIIGIFVMDLTQSPKVNEIIHAYGEYIHGRLGLPKVEKDLQIITLVIKAPQDKISAMTGSLGRIKGIVCKANYASL